MHLAQRALFGTTEHRRPVRQAQIDPFGRDWDGEASDKAAAQGGGSAR
jgi:hypothetical protein